MPHDLPPYRMVFHWFRKWPREGTWQRIHDRSGEHLPRRPGRKPKPPAVVLDRQTVKTTEQDGPRGYAGGKKVVGRKRHVVVDTLGLLWALIITPASVYDCEGGKLALTALRRAVKFPKVIWVDQAYRAWVCGASVLWLWCIEMVTRPRRRFVLPPRR